MWYATFPILAACLAGIVQLSRNKNSVKFRGGKYPNPVKSSDSNIDIVLTESEKEQYHRDGFILKKGVLKGDALVDLIATSEALYAADDPASFSFQKLLFDLWRQEDGFAQVAFEYLPHIAAELMGLSSPDPNNEESDIDSSTAPEETVRILKDGFFAFKSKGNSGCGFHVDDSFFWPATEDSTGVNFWLTLSPIRVAEGGGIRVVNQTASKPILEECRAVIQQKSEHGFPQTCYMETLSPECHQKLTDASTVFDMEPGDALIWDRWTFHRSEPFNVDALEGREDEHRLRYTIRYVPGSAKANYIIDHKLQEKGEKFDSPYYPQVWPKALKSEIDPIQKGELDQHKNVSGSKFFQKK